MATVVRNKSAVTIIWLIICLVTTWREAYGQPGSINLEKNVTVPANSIQLDSLLHLIKKQTGVKFSINTRKIPPTKRIRIKNPKQPIAGVLQEIKQNTGVYYTVLGDHIILLDNPPPGKQKEKSNHPLLVSHSRPGSSASNKRTSLPNKNAPVKKRIVANNKQAVIKLQPPPSQEIATASTPASHDTIPAIVEPDPYKSLVGDTLKLTTASTGKNDSLLARPPALQRSDTITSHSTAPKNNQKVKTRFTANLLQKGGITTDDVFYCSPTLQVGKPYLYGIAAWSSNFNISGFRYGVGSSIPLNDRWKLHLQITTGSLSSKFDTVGERLEFKTRLHRVAFLGEVNIGKRWTLQFGPVLNVMKSTFYLNGHKQASGLPTAFVDKKFNLIQPLYTISDNYSPNAAKSTSIWIGLQAGIFYDFNFHKKE